MIIDTVCAELEEKRNAQIENYNYLRQTEHVSEDSLGVQEAVKTITVSVNEIDNIVSDMLDDLERELDDRTGPLQKEENSQLG
ncbi:hypothetical protein SNE40_019155 [Patella caerulea]|uniref:Uncharacterized protein n=1 Tax=Patella caerulea TaxID=87958 RepID=A0AAN8J6J4_PATCE